MKLNPSQHLKQYIVLFTTLGMFFVSSHLVFSQQSIDGIITDNLGPLPGVSVVEKGTSNGTVTDFDGRYSITTQNKNAILVYSYLGFLTQELVANLGTINIELTPVTDDLDEVIITGYGSQRKATITGAVSSLVKQLKDTFMKIEEE